MSRSFLGLAKTAEFCFEEKRSRFLAYLYPIQQKQDTDALLDTLKQAHPDARHHCTAYVVGDPEQALAAGFNDDGEPGGTAGKPMLNVLMQRKVGNVYAVVVRYFGGVKLGAGGLARAYGAAVSGAVDHAELITVHPLGTMRISIPFALEERVRVCLAKYDIEPQQVEYTTDVTLTIQYKVQIENEIKKSLINITSGQAQFINE